MILHDLYTILSTKRERRGVTAAQLVDRALRKLAAHRPFIEVSHVDWDDQDRITRVWVAGQAFEPKEPLPRRCRVCLEPVVSNCDASYCSNAMCSEYLEQRGGKPVETLSIECRQPAADDAQAESIDSQRQTSDNVSTGNRQVLPDANPENQEV